MLRLTLSALHDPRFYPALLTRKELGTGFLYLVKLLVACWFVVSLWFMALLWQWRANPEQSPIPMPTEILRKVAPQLPTLHIENGKFRLEGAQIVTLTDPETGEKLVHIDTTGHAPGPDAAAVPILLTRSTLFFRANGGEVEFQLPEGITLTLDGQKLEEMTHTAEGVMPYAPLIMLPLNVAGSLLGLVGQWLLMAGIAYIVLKPRRDTTSVPDALRISAFCQSATILLKMLMIGSGIVPFGAPEMVLLGLGFLYLYFALSACLRSPK